MGEEYTYDIGKYTIGVDTNGEGGIGLTVAIIENDKINFLGNCYGDNARCIDLLIRENQELKKQLDCAFDWLRAKAISYESRSEELHYALILYNLIMNLQQENRKLKQQISNSYQIKMKRLQQENRKLKQQISNSHQIKNQQKEFIQWLEDDIEARCIEIKNYHPSSQLLIEQIISTEKIILSKYKEIVGFNGN